MGGEDILVKVDLIVFYVHHSFIQKGKSKHIASS